MRTELRNTWTEWEKNREQQQKMNRRLLTENIVRKSEEREEEVKDNGKHGHLHL